jgi:Ion channel
MLRQILLGGGVSVVNIAIHVLTMVAIIQGGRKVVAYGQAWPIARVVNAMVGTVVILMLAHVAEVLVWALAYAVADVAPEGTDLLYFAFVNYTTLGYGDVVPVERWKLLGPITAMNGILLFGWSTAVIFEVLRAAMRRRGEFARTDV